MHETVTWVGSSGSHYMYYVYDLEIDLPPRMGNFIYARLNDGKNWQPIYFGEGDLATGARARPDLMSCIKMKGATHLHLRCNSSAHDRSTEVEDLLLRFGAAFAPGGCHADRYETCVWTGKSQTPYVFYVYEKAILITMRQGIYICARRTVDQIWTPVAIGQGDLSLNNPEIARWTQSADCTHIHRCLWSREADRSLIQDDLRQNYAQFLLETMSN